MKVVTKKKKGRAGNRTPTSGILCRLHFSNHFSIKNNFCAVYLNHGTVNISLLGRSDHNTVTVLEHLFWSTCFGALVLEHLFWITCLGELVLEHLFWSTCFGELVLENLFWSTCFGALLLEHLFWSTCFGALVLEHLFLAQSLELL
jgi:hypothetical protein